MVGASWRLARTMFCEVGAKMGPISNKIAQGGDLGAVLAPSWVQYFFSRRVRGLPGRPDFECMGSAGGGGVARGG